MSGTKFSIGLGGRGVKALCGKATSWGQSSAEGTPTTLQGWMHLSAQLEPMNTYLLKIHQVAHRQSVCQKNCIASNKKQKCSCVLCRITSEFCVLCWRGRDRAPLQTDDEPGCLGPAPLVPGVPTEGTKHGKDLGSFRGSTMETLRNIDLNWAKLHVYAEAKLKCFDSLLLEIVYFDTDRAK